MKKTQFGNKYLVRIDKGEEIISVLTKLCEEEGIKLASVSALGAASKIKVGLYNVPEKEYISKEFEGMFEITSLMGTVSTMDNKTYIHLHITFSDAECKVYGGHMNYCYVGATCEMVVDRIDGQTDRKFDEDLGLNIFEF